MQVRDIRIECSGKRQELSGMLGDFRAWWRFPADYQLSTRGDAFLAVALVPAMAQGEAVEIDESTPVSPMLLAGVERIQEIFHCWNPALKKVPIRVSTSVPEVLQDGVGSFFSGGVDSGYTLAKHAQEISQLIFIRGFDLDYDKEDVYIRAQELYRDVAEQLGKKLVFVETNLKQFYQRLGINAYVYLGSVPASIGLALGLRRVYMAASHTYGELLPCGTHSLVDPLWSTEATQFVHDGAEARRTEKVQKIASRKELMKVLRVCLESRNDNNYNCGVCSKCLRTMINLRLLGLSVPTLPPLTSLAPLRNLRVKNQYDLTFYDDNLRLAEEKGNRELAAILRSKMRRYFLVKHVKEMDKEFLGGCLKRSLSQLRKFTRKRPTVLENPHIAFIDD